MPIIGRWEPARPEGLGGRARPTGKGRCGRRGGAGLVAVALALAGTGLSAGSAAAAGASKKANLPAPAKGLRGTVQIGAALPLTGGIPVLGQAQERGVQLAAAEVNHDGGVLGKKLKVDFADTQTKTTQAVQAAEQLVTVDHVPVVVGELLSDDTIAMGKYLQQQGVVEINPGSSSPTVSSIGSYSFSTIGMDTLAGRLAADHLYAEGRRKIAILEPNTSYGTGITNVVVKRFKQLGGKVMASILYTTGASDYRSDLQRLESSGAQTYVYSAYEPSDVTIDQEAYELGIPIKQFYSIYIATAVEGSPKKTIAGMTGQSLAYTGPHGKSFVKEFKAAFGKTLVSPYSSYAYDAVMIAAAAINEAHSTTPAAIRTALHKVGQHYQGVTGTITFNAHNQRESVSYDLQTVTGNGKVKTTGSATVTTTSTKP